MAGPSAWTLYDQFKNQLGKKSLDLSADTFKVALFTSSSDCANSAHATAKYSDFSNEVAATHGYSTGGASCSGPSFTNAAGVQSFALSGAPVFTASGGTIVSRYAVLYDSTDTNKRAIAYCILDSTPADLTIPDTQSMTLVLNTVFTLS
jgi:hypothetical protein